MIFLITSPLAVRCLSENGSSVVQRGARDLEDPPQRFCVQVGLDRLSGRDGLQPIKRRWRS